MEIFANFEKVVGEGRALAHWSGKALFCLGPLPGETARVRITRDKSRWAEAELIEITTASPARRPALEQHYLSCSPWQAVDYGNQRELKKIVLSEAFARGGVEVSPDIAPSPLVLGYRNKLEFSLIADGPDKVQAAFYHRGTYQSFEAAPDGCCLGSDDMNEALINVIRSINNIDNPGIFGSVIIRSDSPGGLVAALMLRSDAAHFATTDAQALATRIAGETPALSGLAIARRLTHDRTELVASQGGLVLTERLRGIDVSYRWDGFFQVNPRAFAPALDKITEAVLSDGPAVDLYGGVGVIGLAVAGIVPTVTGIEIDPGSVELANRNAQRAGLANYRAVAVAAERLDPALLNGAATIIVDPPRAGLHPKALAMIRAARPRRIIYLSCNPSTQARDIVELMAYYRAGVVQGFDFYPGTPHLESLAVLDRLDQV